MAFVAVVMLAFQAAQAPSIESDGDKVTISAPGGLFYSSRGAADPQSLSDLLARMLDVEASIVENAKTAEVAAAASTAESTLIAKLSAAVEAADHSTRIEA